MTVSSSTNKVSYSGNGSLTTFAYTFKIFDQGDLTVILRAADGTETTQTITTHYTVSGVGSASGGNVVFGTAPASGVTVVIIREQPLTQGLDLVANDPFPAESLEEALDKLVFMSQKHEEELGRAIKASRTNTLTGSEFTISASDRANKVFAFDSSGNVSITSELGTFKGNWSASTAYVQRDIVKDTSTNNIFIANTAHTSSGAQPLTTNTDSAKWDLLVDAASATTAQTAAAASATAAAASETASAASETASAASQAAAATSATNSANSATASAASATSAAASYDSFDDRYLGAKSTSGGDPSTDNDGDPLVDGALFFDTTNNVMKVYNLGTTTWLRTTPTTSDQTAINAVNADATDIGLVAGSITNVNNVGGDITNVNTVAGQISPTNNISTVAGISSAVSTVAGDTTAINALSAVTTEIGLLGVSSVITDMGFLGTADAVADMAILGTSDVVADMAILGTSANVTAMSHLGTADVVADMAILGTTDVVADMALLGTSANVTAMSNVSGSISNVNTVASSISDVNSFANQYRISADNPTASLDAGDLAYVTNDSVLKYFNGTDWVSISPGIGNVVDDSTPQLGGNLDTNGNEIAFDDGSSTTNRLKFGASNDLQIYHDSSSDINIITGNGSNTSTDTYIFTNDNFAIRKGTPSSSENMVFGTGDGAVYLYHNGFTRLQTSTTGVSVTGDLTTSDDLFVNGSFARIQSSSTATLELRNTDTSATENQELGVIDFYGSDSSSPGAGVKASIKVKAESTAGDGSSMQFYTSSTLTNEVLALEIDRNQNLMLFNSPVIYFWDDNSTNYAAIDVPDDVTSSYFLTLPAAAPSAADQILVSDASGNLSFEDKPVAGGTAFSAF